MLDSESPHNLFPCWLSALLPSLVSFPSFSTVFISFSRKGFLTCPGCFLLSRLTLSQPWFLMPLSRKEGLTRGLQWSSLSHQHLCTDYLSDCTVTFPGMKLVTRRQRWRSWLLIGVTLQLTAFLACTIFRPQTTPFFCVWKACSCCWALGTNQPLYWEL